MFSILDLAAKALADRRRRVDGAAVNLMMGQSPNAQTPSNRRLKRSTRRPSSRSEC
jgi:hypothetical protein